MMVVFSGQHGIHILHICHGISLSMAVTCFRIVYIRYKDVDNNVTATFQDDIILDVTPPTGSVSILNETSLRPASVGIVTLLLDATDDVSGVGSMQIGSDDDFSGEDWEPLADTHEWEMDPGNVVYVRYRDNAGNVSEVYQALKTLNSFFL